MRREASVYFLSAFRHSSAAVVRNLIMLLDLARKRKVRLRRKESKFN
jgi:hypothetical protein